MTANPAATSVAATATDRLVACEDDARWDDFVARSPQGSVFARSWYLRAIASTGQARADRWWLLDAGRRPLAGALVLRDGPRPLDAPFPFSPYQSLFLSPEVARAPVHRSGKEIVDVSTSLVSALADRYARLSFCCHPAFNDVRGLQWFRYGQPDAFTLDVRYTGLVDLRATPDFDSYLGTIRPTRRYKYRRAVAGGLRAERSEDLVALDALHVATFARQGISRPEHEGILMRAIATAALAEGAGELLLCRAPSGAPASATLFLYDERCGYYLIGANAPEHRSLNSGTFLMLEAIRRCQERKLEMVDMCGVNSPERGDFKTSLGAVPTPYFLARWSAVRQ